VLIDVMRNVSRLGIRRNDEQGHARAQSKLIELGWDYVVIQSAEIVPGYKDDCRIPIGSA
jgi:hypothetical protein